MGLFNKKEKEVEKNEVPTLPELPKLPEFPQSKENKIDSIHQLPSFPTNSFGEKFSQNAIKEAVAGKKEGEGVFDADEFENDEIQMKPRPLKKIKEFSDIKTTKFAKPYRKMTKSLEPIFIRIDKFEESLEILEKTKEKISEMEKILGEIKRTKEEEEQQLEFWEKEIQMIKGQIDKVDKNIFSQIE